MHISSRISHTAISLSPIRILVFLCCSLWISSVFSADLVGVHIQRFPFLIVIFFHRVWLFWHFLLTILVVSVVSCCSLFLGGRVLSGHFLSSVCPFSGLRIHIVGVRVALQALESLCGIPGICFRELLPDVLVGILESVWGGLSSRLAF